MILFCHYPSGFHNQYLIPNCSCRGMDTHAKSWDSSFMAFLKYLREMTNVPSLRPRNRAACFWGLHFQDATFGSGTWNDFPHWDMWGKIFYGTPMDTIPIIGPTGLQALRFPTSDSSAFLLLRLLRFEAALLDFLAPCPSFGFNWRFLQPAEVAAWAVPTHPPDYEGWGSKWTSDDPTLEYETHARHIETECVADGMWNVKDMPKIPKTMPPKRTIFHSLGFCWRNLKDPQKNQNISPISLYRFPHFLVFPGK